MSAETSTRPFQVGDPVKITDYDVMTGKTIRTHTGKIRSLQGMSASDASDWVTCIADVDEPYLMGKSEMLHTVAIVHLVPDRTRSTWPSNQTIELLEPAPADSPSEAPQDHGPLAATLSDRTLAKVLSRPAHVPLSEMKSTRVFGFNVVTISPQGIPGGPRLDGVVSRQRAQDELDELEPFMVDGWKTVMVELREVTS